MDFKTATDVLADCPTHQDLADAIGASLPAIRQARLDPETWGHRNPPPGWQAGVAMLARARAAALTKLADQLEREG